MIAPSRVRPLTIPAVALASFFHVHCVPDCPGSMVREYDQCVGHGAPEKPGTGGKGTGGAPGVGGGSGAEGSSGGAPVDSGPDRSASGGTGGVDIPDAEAVDSATPDAEVDASPCEPGSVWSTDACISRRLFVSPDGNDGNDGGPDSPLRSFGAAMEKVRPHQHVAFADGTWGFQTTRDTFAQSIPVDVVVEKWIPGTTVVFNGSGTASLTFAGTGRLRDVTIMEFEKPLAASSGRPVASNVTFKNSMGSLLVGGSAEFTCSSCFFREDDSNAAPSVGIKVRDFASLYTEGGSFDGPFQNAIRADTAGAVSLQSTHFATGIDNVVVVGGFYVPTALFKAEGCRFEGTVQLVAPIQVIRIRGSTIGSVLIGGHDQIADLGVPGDAGANLFKRTGVAFDLPYLRVTGWGNVVRATGNTWRANEQAANDEGRYPAPRNFFSGESGVNIEIKSEAVDGGGDLSRVEL